MRLLLIGAVMMASTQTRADSSCTYKLLAFLNAGQRTYAIAANPTEQTPTEAIRIDRKLGIKSDITAAELFSKATQQRICEFSNAAKAQPEEFSSERAKIKQAELLPPIPQPKNIIAVGLNYAVHNEEVGVDSLVLFPKNTGLTSAFSKIERPDGSLLDWEVELGIVFRRNFGPEAKVTAENISDYIAGFTVLNDITDRVPIILDIERGFSRGKTYPGFLPTGPYFVPIENFSKEFQVNPAKELRLTVNDLEKQRENSGKMLHSILEIIPRIFANAQSDWIDAQGKQIKLLATKEIQAGDLVSSGTPGGTAIIAPGLGKKLGLGLKALARRQKPRWVFINEEYCSGKYLREGDIVSAEIAGLGKQVNQVEERFLKEKPIACDRQGQISEFLSSDKPKIMR